ncbi:putative peptidoglycan hydrolase yvbx, not involved in spore germination [hydrocarbon metagenome]|uniref:Putative peptidoglycan hydrolase yvbx, not involved in spore germination n=1 Tax=hydrocarbon metagenome TaxID=938273 RepID=A0A0W8E791_9ZZZZ
MKDNWKYSLLLVILSTFVFAFTAQASTNPGISINGELREISPPAVIKNDRTMVPVRFIVEDELLQGEVYWDGKQQKVAMNCRGKYIEFFIGSSYARVDGQTLRFDTAPYIYQDRTYVPLRFLVEALGASVSWNSQACRVNIQFDYSPRVFAYYYYSSGKELNDNIRYFTDIAFRWYETNEYGHLSYEYKDDYQAVLDLVSRHNVKTHASVVLMDSSKLHQLLSNSQNRKMLIGNLMDQVNKYGYDGVNIDFEFINAGDAAHFTTFLKELKAVLGAEKELSAAVFARTESDQWPTGYEYAKIGQIADQVVVMAYDYHYKTSSAGAVAPLWWVEKVVDYMTARIPAHKIMLGMATYGYDWSSNGSAQTITAEKLAGIKEKYQVTEHFDSKSMSPYYTYSDEYKNSHEIWMENERSLKGKLDKATGARLGGISFWRIGNGFYDLYQLLGKQGYGSPVSLR